MYGIQVVRETNIAGARELNERQHTALTAALDLNEQSLEYLQKLTFSPDAKGKVFFNIILLFAAFFSTFASTYIACFGFPERRISLFLDRFSEICFIVEIILNFFMQYSDEADDYKLQTSLRKIAGRYAKGGLLPDLIGMLPFFFQILDTFGESRQTLELV